MSDKYILYGQTTLPGFEEEKEGSWVKSEYNGYSVCSVCYDCFVDTDWIASGKWKYCPSCGAHMSCGVSDEQK